MDGWVTNREAGDLRRHRAHYDAIVMKKSMLSNVEVYGGLYTSPTPCASLCWVNCHSHQWKLSLNEWFFVENILETMNFVAFQLSGLKIAQTAVYETKHSVCRRFLTEMVRSPCWQFWSPVAPEVVGATSTPFQWFSFSIVIMTENLESRLYPWNVLFSHWLLFHD